MEKVYQEVHKRISKDATEKGCLEWLGYKDKDGYGLKTFMIDGKYKTFRTHRLVYMSVNGDIESGQVIRHTCDNPKCCNIEHLLVGTSKQNSQDKVSRGRASGGRMCGTRNPNNKLTPEQVKEIREATITNTALAVRFSVSKVLIGLIKRNKIWVNHNEVQD